MLARSGSPRQLTVVGPVRHAVPLQGHKIKNPKMQLVQRLHDIPVAVRIIISGTPIQNNLMEMHSLFDFACEVIRQPLKTCHIITDSVDHTASN